MAALDWTQLKMLFYLIDCTSGSGKHIKVMCEISLVEKTSHQSSKIE